jgi:hypothetical protein
MTRRLEADKKNRVLLAAILEHDVLPFWREASDRLSEIDLKSDSPNIPRLDLLQDVADSRVKGLRAKRPGLHAPQHRAAAHLGTRGCARVNLRPRLSRDGRDRPKPGGYGDELTSVKQSLAAKFARRRSLCSSASMPPLSFASLTR